jgi:predicted nucleic acid-binding protein
MKYVLDSSVALKIALPEPDSGKAIQLRDDFRAGIHELLAPDVFPVEVAHALTRAERQQRILPLTAWGLWQKIMADCPALSPASPLTPRAIGLSSQFRIGVYDCLYVALAEREGCELVTADQRLVKAFPVGVSIVLLSAL